MPVTDALEHASSDFNFFHSFWFLFHLICIENISICQSPATKSRSSSVSSLIHHKYLVIIHHTVTSSQTAAMAMTSHTQEQGARAGQSSSVCLSEIWCWIKGWLRGRVVGYEHCWAVSSLVFSQLVFGLLMFCLCMPYDR